MNASDSRAASSSSITCTVEASFDIVEFLLGHTAKSEPKDGSPGGIGFAVDLPAVTFNDRARDRQPDAHAMALRCNKGMKKLRSNFGRYANSSIRHADGNHAVSGRSCGHHQVTLCAPLHSLDCVPHQV